MLTTLGRSARDRTYVTVLIAALTSRVCADERVPVSVTKKFEQATNLIEQAAAKPSRKATHLFDRAATALRQAKTRAARAATGKKPKMSSDCADALKSAADQVARGLQT